MCAITDGEGRYRLDVSPGPHELEVTAAGYSPGRTNATASVGATVTADVVLTPLVVAVVSMSVEDAGAGGYANGTVGFDEAFRLSVTVSNNGSDATDVSAVLSATGPGVVVARGLSAYPAIPAGGTGTNLTPFELRVTRRHLTGQPIGLLLTMQTAQGPTTVPFSLPTTGTPLNAPVSFTATGPLSFRGGSVDMPIPVAGLTSAIANVEVAVHVHHPQPHHITMPLIGPETDHTSGFLKNSTGTSTNADLGTDCPADDNDTNFADDGSEWSFKMVAPAVGRFRPPDALSRSLPGPSSARGS